VILPEVWLLSPLKRLELVVATALISIVANQILMPDVNTARHTGAKGRLNRLHGLSVALNMAQLLAIAAFLVRLA
jgi:hypothetical protein